MRSRPVEARVVAQAKINVFLRVLARSADGYHSLETLFLRVDLGDVVRVRVADDDRRSIVCHGPALPTGGLGPADQNLAYRAAAAYADVAGWPTGFAVDVEKHVPVGAGLGGGSADAAAVLRVLDTLSPDPIGSGPLAEIAVGLGADVPFLVGESACALAWGRGERLLQVRPPPAREVELLVPSFSVSTKWAYQQLAAVRATAPPRPAVHRVAELSSWSRLASIATNDLEPVIAAHHPEIAACVTALRERRARIAIMTGSGSCVVGVFERSATSAPDATATRVPEVTVRSLHTRTSTRVVGVEIIE